MILIGAPEIRTAESAIQESARKVPDPLSKMAGSGNETFHGLLSCLKLIVCHFYPPPPPPPPSAVIVTLAMANTIQVYRIVKPQKGGTVSLTDTGVEFPKVSGWWWCGGRGF